ncbi:hypothetical protein [Mycolicibacterium grossiae]|uniref:Uncharacterized protein n=1 Tax=Mycolicibacterium grossiae TaxID=1552759 RepID=A0A1E8Q4Z2_9MYCO|nr:hypothetical protein [Mycolicibacterium grossiae]OFJ53129.1 hypothetical protein BEL07_13930 [Mycolicibacterium grossiae]QEM44763.1 hypothetical protein FZ046_08180 [Mycolicibacterium grossiae]
MLLLFVRRWALTALLLPAIAFVLAKAGRFLQRRHDGRQTKTSKALLSASNGLQRFTKRGRAERR